ncbi:MAG TPA: ABC transporter substrate-binding protein [Streptosporangiaceae bacterium]|nr:ABC transporter substrate-binding protein [Streptosporangiaceae bacterium]
MSDFEQWLRRSLDAAVADADPPEEIMQLVLKKHTQRVIRLIVSATAAVVLLTGAVPLARAWHGGGQHPAATSASGVLKIVAAYGPDHVDTVPAYYTPDYILERAYARQLVSYQVVPDPSLTSSGWLRDITPVPDLATQLPTAGNGGITDGGRVYTFHIRPGADWDTSPARQVTAADFVREFKAFCSPAQGGFVGNLGYYANTIAGLTSYCDAESAFFFGTNKHPVTAANVAAFQNSHAISGIVAVNPLTIRFRLVSRTSDFLNLLAMPFASARPVEYDSYLPDSSQLDRHVISDGPYAIGPFVNGKSIVLHRNPAWRQSTDPIRHQYVKEIIVTTGVTNAATQISDLRQGKYDLMLDTEVPVSSLPSLSRSPQFHIWPDSNQIPYVVFNLRSPNSKHAVGNLLVRRAIEFGVNKVAVQRIFGGPAVAKVIGSMQTPGNFGATNADPYPSPGEQGNVAKCKSLVNSAGYSKGLKLKLLYKQDPTAGAVFNALKASLARCGIHLTADPVPLSEYYQRISDEGKNNKPGAYDLGLANWESDWFGNNGRALLDPLFRTQCVNLTTNYGCYSNPAVDHDLTAAETAMTATQAARSLAAADRQIMADAAAVPLTDLQSTIFSSARVREAGLRAGVVYAPNLGGPDITNISLLKG